MSTEPKQDRPSHAVLSTAGFGVEGDEEKYLHMMLANLHEAHTKAAQPFVNRLLAIQSMKQPKFFIPLDGEFASVLHDGLWNLYETDETHNAQAQGREALCHTGGSMKVVGYYNDEGVGEFTPPTSGAVPEHGWKPVVLLDDALDVIREFVPPDIEQFCDECGGDKDRCREVNPRCIYPRARALLTHNAQGNAPSTAQEN